VFRGELVGGKIANLLPGVWSTRTYIKIRNRTCETLLDGWAEPWAALGRALGAPDEHPAIRVAWRQLLQNQAHDSICGCSQDAVHEQMLGRYDYAEELARETLTRTCERIAGLGAERRTPWSDELDIAVFNPSPHPRTDVVRFPLQGYPPFDQKHQRPIHPLVWRNMRPGGFEVDVIPARLVAIDENNRYRLISEQSDWDVEFVAIDVPAFGWKRVRLTRSDEHPDTTDEGRYIAAGDVSVNANDDGTLDVRFGDKAYHGLGALEDTGDRGDTYDYDPVLGGFVGGTAEFTRRTHPGGIQTVTVRRTLAIPMLDETRNERSERSHYLEVTTEARVAPGVDRVDLRISIHNEATDHRLRMLFPTGAAAESLTAATTFDVVDRSTARTDDTGWIHPAPTTFPAQGWASANGLCVVAPGLYEYEVTPDGVIAVTLLRSVGWLSRMDLTTRPQHAGPGLATPGAQCVRTFETHISLLRGADSRAARDAELGFVATAVGDAPLHPDAMPLVSLEPRELVLSALKPAERSDGFVVRVLNPTDDAQTAVVRFGFDVTSASGVRLDEEPASHDVTVAGRELRFEVPPHALRSVLAG
jgi:mannosylglycerate hydrolase